MNEEFQENQIPDSWEIGDQQLAFPEGSYICAFGKIIPMYGKDQEDKAEPSSLAHEIWMIKFNGNANTKPQVRIRIIGGKVQMAGTRGIKKIEFYPNPKFQPNMSWKAKAFFSNFEGCIEDILTGELNADGEPKRKKVVSWKKIQSLYGLVFQADLKWNKSKKDGKMYFNFDVGSIEAGDATIPSDHMRQIEETYEALRDTGSNSLPSVNKELDDLPF